MKSEALSAWRRRAWHRARATDYPAELDAAPARGPLVLYSGTPIIDGVDPFLESLSPLVQLPALQFVYEEIDPVFGEEFERHAYAHADRIAVVGLTLIKG
jgi:hypothetical protein